MGVNGLWKALDKARVTTDSEHFQNKKMAIDISIVIYRILRSKQTNKNKLFKDIEDILLYVMRILRKLMYYNVKPVIVFDGGIPNIKVKSIKQRRLKRIYSNVKANRMLGITESGNEPKSVECMQNMQTGPIVCKPTFGDVSNKILDPFLLPKNNMAINLLVLKCASNRGLGFKSSLKNTIKNSLGISEGLILVLKELFGLFGIPVVQSPMESDAQCSYLCNKKLVDCVATEDADILLYFDQTNNKSEDNKVEIYRDVFSTREKKVSYYTFDNIRKETGLDHNKLIFMVYLVGSDYNEGIKGVGTIWGLEIADFLESFRKTIEKDNEFDRNDILCVLITLRDIVTDPTCVGNYRFFLQDPNMSYLNKLLMKIKPEDFPSNFPDFNILDAWENPIVEEIDKLEWNKPDLKGIKSFLVGKLDLEETMIENELNKFVFGCKQMSLAQYIKKMG